MLWSILQSLEFSHLSDVHQASLCVDFASQLEAIGEWHWSAFVLLHIEDDTQ